MHALRCLLTSKYARQQFTECFCCKDSPRASCFARAACRRVGGAFGGKVARSMPVAAAAAVAAAKTGRRVRYSLGRNDDMRINGGALLHLSPLIQGTHPYALDSRKDSFTQIPDLRVHPCHFAIHMLAQQHQH